MMLLILLIRRGALNDGGAYIHAGWFESALVLALMALSSAAVWLLLWAALARPMLLLLAGWLGLCLFTGRMLAISAGPAPVVDRTIVA